MYAKHNVLNNEATTHKDAIAIIGIGFKGPGAENLEQLWEVLEGGKNYVLDLPKDRWNVDAFYDPDPQATGKYYTRKAGLLSNPLDFDNTFFDINDIESDQMDPQQKFVLECSYRAMEHAGITRRSIQGSKTGVYIGAMNCDYRGLFPVGYSVVSNYTVTGVSNSIIAARVSYAFDLRGPCMVLDTGCSSALLAIHTASQALLNGDCTMAICGGTNFIGSPDIFIHLSKAQMVSPTGQCHAFSEQADGYTRGEGCGIVLLKKLSD
ncbi:polyketide synthase 16, partial [Biomphalaria glabrata]